MNYILYGCLFLCCSCRSYNLQEPAIPAASLPLECPDLYQFVQTCWYKHRKNPYHKLVENPTAFVWKYKNCLEKLNKSQLVGLLGPPDKMEHGQYIYFMKKDCKDMDWQNSYDLTMSFKGEAVWRAEISWRYGAEY